MKYTSRISQTGTSKAIIVPKVVLEALDASVGDLVSVDLNVIKPPLKDDSAAGGGSHG